MQRGDRAARLRGSGGAAIDLLVKRCDELERIVATLKRALPLFRLGHPSSRPDRGGADWPSIDNRPVD